MITEPVSREEIDNVFDIFFPYLELIYFKAEGEDPQAIYERLTSGSYTLHLVGEEGFCIFSWDAEGCHAVSAAAWVRNTTGVVNIIKAAADYARQLNCRKLSFSSPRRGWRKIAEQIGAVRDGELYEVML